MSPENKLWQAVVACAFNDALAEIPSVEAARSGRNARHRATAITEQGQARTWLTCFSRDFVDVCQHAGYDPTFIRGTADRLAAEGWPSSLIAAIEADNELAALCAAD